MNFAGKKLIQKSLEVLVAREIGQVRWKRILRQLAEAEKSTGGVLRKWPRRAPMDRMGNDDRYPVWLFAPDRDKEGREFESVVEGELVYIRQDSAQKDTCNYTVYFENDTEWWADLTNQQKELIISILSYILCAPADPSSIVEFLGRK